VFRRQTDKNEKKTLWTEYPEYNPINNIDEKPLYDESKVSEQHRILGQIIRENWQLVHPLSKDYMLSAASEWRKLILKNDSLETKDLPPPPPDSLERIQAENEMKTKRLLLEKDAEIERIKEALAEKYEGLLEEKDEQIKHYKMLSASVESSLEEQEMKSDLEKELVAKERKIADLMDLIDTLKDKCDTLEVEAKTVQTGISQNFQKQINELSTELYTRIEQNEKLREVLEKAKDQLILLKNKNNNLLKEKQELLDTINDLDSMVQEREKKLQAVRKTIETLD
jgi:hypothetical protein